MTVDYGDKETWGMSLAIAAIDATIALAAMFDGLYWVGALMLVAIAVLLTILYFALK